MIEYARIRRVIEAMADAAEIKIVRANQVAPRPSYPLATYQVMQLIGWDPMQYCVGSETKAGDAATVTQSSFETIKVPISLNFVGLGTPDALYAFAAKAKAWILSTAGREFCAAQNIVPRLVGDITDRSAIIDTDAEIRIGFDIRLDCDNVTIDEIEVMEKIALNGETIEPLQEQEGEQDGLH